MFVIVISNVQIKSLELNNIFLSQKCALMEHKFFCCKVFIPKRTWNQCFVNLNDSGYTPRAQDKPNHVRMSTTLERGSEPLYKVHLSRSRNIRVTGQ